MFKISFFTLVYPFSCVYFLAWFFLLQWSSIN